MRRKHGPGQFAIRVARDQRQQLLRQLRDERLPELFETPDVAIMEPRQRVEREGVGIRFFGSNLARRLGHERRRQLRDSRATWDGGCGSSTQTLSARARNSMGTQPCPSSRFWKVASDTLSLMIGLALRTRLGNDSPSSYQDTP